VDIIRGNTIYEQRTNVGRAEDEQAIGSSKSGQMLNGDIHCIVRPNEDIRIAYEQHHSRDGHSRKGPLKNTKLRTKTPRGKK